MVTLESLEDFVTRKTPSSSVESNAYESLRNSPEPTSSSFRDPR
jgi:hypothetical protein